MLRVAMSLVGAALSLGLAAAGTSPSAKRPPARFRLVILDGDWFKLGLGYQNEPALAKLREAPTTGALFVVEAGQIESYDWRTQAITLTPEATRRLAAALAGRPGPAGAEDLKRLEQGLGWGSALERALYIRPFVVRLGEEHVYGGIFLNAPSQMAIDYPVIRCSAAPGGRAVLRVLPVHLAFFDLDPGDDEAPTATRELLTRDYGPLDDVPAGLLDSFREQARSPLARSMRALVRDPRIREDLLRSGKLREGAGTP